jgi:hypothetical protein
MRNERSIWLVGAVVGALDAALVVAVLVASGALMGSAFALIDDLFGLAFVLGPGWLGPAVAAGSILAAGLIGGRAARRGKDSLFSAAVVAVLVFVAGYVAWVFMWTLWRLGTSAEIGSAPFLPFHAALLTLAGLLLPAIVLFLPAGLLWAWVVRAVLGGGSARGRERMT